MGVPLVATRPKWRFGIICGWPSFMLVNDDGFSHIEPNLFWTKSAKHVIDPSKTVTMVPRFSCSGHDHGHLDLAHDLGIYPTKHGFRMSALPKPEDCFFCMSTETHIMCRGICISIIIYIHVYIIYLYYLFNIYIYILFYIYNIIYI